MFLFDPFEFMLCLAAFASTNKSFIIFLYGLISPCCHLFLSHITTHFTTTFNTITSTITNTPTGAIGRLRSAAGLRRNQAVQHPQGLWRVPSIALRAHLLQPAWSAGILNRRDATREIADCDSRGLWGIWLCVKEKRGRRKWRRNGDGMRRREECYRKEWKLFGWLKEGRRKESGISTRTKITYRIRKLKN